MTFDFRLMDREGSQAVDEDNCGGGGGGVIYDSNLGELVYRNFFLEDY